MAHARSLVHGTHLSPESPDTSNPIGWYRRDAPGGTTIREFVYRGDTCTVPAVTRRRCRTCGNWLIGLEQRGERCNRCIDTSVKRIRNAA